MSYEALGPKDTDPIGREMTKEELAKGYYCYVHAPERIATRAARVPCNHKDGGYLFLCAECATVKGSATVFAKYQEQSAKTISAFKQENTNS